MKPKRPAEEFRMKVSDFDAMMRGALQVPNDPTARKKAPVAKAKVRKGAAGNR